MADNNNKIIDFSSNTRDNINQINLGNLTSGVVSQTPTYDLGKDVLGVMKDTVGVIQSVDTLSTNAFNEEYMKNEEDYSQKLLDVENQNPQKQYEIHKQKQESLARLQAKYTDSFILQDARNSMEHTVKKSWLTSEKDITTYRVKLNDDNVTNKLYNMFLANQDASKDVASTPEFVETLSSAYNPEQVQDSLFNLAHKNAMVSFKMDNLQDYANKVSQVVKLSHSFDKHVPSAVDQNKIEQLVSGVGYRQEKMDEKARKEWERKQKAKRAKKDGILLYYTRQNLNQIENMVKEIASTSNGVPTPEQLKFLQSLVNIPVTDEQGNLTKDTADIGQILIAPIVGELEGVKELRLTEDATALSNSVHHLINNRKDYTEASLETLKTIQFTKGKASADVVIDDHVSNKKSLEEVASAGLYGRMFETYNDSSPERKEWMENEFISLDAEGSNSNLVEAMYHQLIQNTPLPEIDNENYKNALGQAKVLVLKERDKQKNASIGGEVKTGDRVATIEGHIMFPERIQTSLNKADAKMFRDKMTPLLQESFNQGSLGLIADNKKLTGLLKSGAFSMGDIEDMLEKSLELSPKSETETSRFLKSYYSLPKVQQLGDINSTLMNFMFPKDKTLSESDVKNTETYKQLRHSPVALAKYETVAKNYGEEAGKFMTNHYMRTYSDSEYFSMQGIPREKEIYKDILDDEAKLPLQTVFMKDSLDKIKKRGLFEKLPTNVKRFYNGILARHTNSIGRDLLSKSNIDVVNTPRGYEVRLNLGRTESSNDIPPVGYLLTDKDYTQLKSVLEEFRIEVFKDIERKENAPVDQIQYD